MAGALFDIAGSIAGLLGNQAKNRDAKLQFAQQKDLANSQSGIAGLLQQIAIAQGNKGTGTSDEYGGGAQYDPATGTWKSTLGAPQKAVQDASYSEEAARMSGDQAIRRYGLGQADQLRQGAVGDAQSAQRSYNLFNQGVGAVDPDSIAASMRLSRTGAVNAGYDQAQKAAGTMSLRTGTAAGDTFAGLARNRAQDLARSAGDPYTEALQLAEGINNSRGQQKLGAYNLFADRGSNFYDAQFNPSTYAQQGQDNAFKSAGLQLDNFNASTGAMGNAAATYGSAAAGLRGGAQQQMQNTNYAAPAQFINSMGTALDNAGGIKSILSKLGI